MRRFNYVFFNFIFIILFLLLSIFLLANVNLNEDKVFSEQRGSSDTLKIEKDSAKNKKFNKESYLVSKRKFFRDHLVQEVRDYIEKNSVRSPISADSIVKICNKHNMPIPFVLAQAHLESHFGTRGVASITGSIFNVGTYDNGVILFTYRNPNKSIEPYIELLKDDYLVRGKNINDLMQPNSFVNYKGYRYASNMFYEKELKKIYEKINDKTNILTYQRELTEVNYLEFKDKELKYFYTYRGKTEDKELPTPFKKYVE